MPYLPGCRGASPCAAAAILCAGKCAALWRAWLRRCYVAKRRNQCVVLLKGVLVRYGAHCVAACHSSAHSQVLVTGVSVAQGTTRQELIQTSHTSILLSSSPRYAAKVCSMSRWRTLYLDRACTPAWAQTIHHHELLGHVRQSLAFRSPTPFPGWQGCCSAACEVVA
jgi:hypothetical protein